MTCCIILMKRFFWEIRIRNKIILLKKSDLISPCNFQNKIDEMKIMEKYERQMIKCKNNENALRHEIK